MRTMRIAMLTALLVTSTWTLQVVRAEQTQNTPGNENQKEQSYMTDEKVIMLIEAKIQPQRHAELIKALREYLPLVRAEPGVEAFYVTARKDDPNALVFYEIYKSQAAQDFHLQQDFTKRFLATLKSAQAADRVRTNLVELSLR
jgi:quinol monooxygenase YgiN